MIDFRKVSRQLREEPLPNRNPLQAQGDTGKRGHFFEGKVAKLLDHFGKSEDNRHEGVKARTHNVIGERSTRKADIVDENGGGSVSYTHLTLPTTVIV